MFPFHFHHAPRAVLYHEQFVDPEAGLNKITPIGNGTLSEMIHAGLHLPPHQFATCYIKVDGRTVQPADIQHAAEETD